MAIKLNEIIAKEDLLIFIEILLEDKSDTNKRLGLLFLIMFHLKSKLKEVEDVTYKDIMLHDTFPTEIKDKVHKYLMTKVSKGEDMLSVNITPTSQQYINKFLTKAIYKYKLHNVEGSLLKKFSSHSFKKCALYEIYTNNNNDFPGIAPTTKRDLLIYLGVLERKSGKRKLYKTYLMKNQRNGYYKIGISDKPKQRELTLQSEDPDVLMVKVWDKNIEKELHHRYDSQRLRGEWFNLSKVQLMYMCKHY